MEDTWENEGGSTPDRAEPSTDLACPECHVVMTSEYLHWLHPSEADIRLGRLAPASAPEQGFDNTTEACRHCPTPDVHPKRIGGVLSYESAPEQGEPTANLREQLAALEHEQWEKWSRTVAEQGLTPERIERWQRYWVPYADLDEPTKDFDREWADRVLSIVAASGAHASEQSQPHDACPDCGGQKAHLKGCPNPVPRLNTVIFTPPADVGEIAGIVRYYYSERSDCICCDGPHVYGYRLDGDDGKQLDVSSSGWVYRMLRSVPDGTRLRFSADRAASGAQAVPPVDVERLRQRLLDAESDEQPDYVPTWAIEAILDEPDFSQCCGNYLDTGECCAAVNGTAALTDREHPSGSPQTEAGRALLEGDFIEADYDGCNIDVDALNNGIVAIEREAAARREPLDVEALRLYDTVAAMRAVIGHDHTEPWPCPVKAVDDALAALARKHGLWDRPTPDDLADNIAARLSSIPAREDVDNG